MQTRLPLQIAANVALVDIGTARAVKGLDTESLVALTESGEFRWVWDVGTGRNRRELRFWRLELVDASVTNNLLMPAVIDTILPTTRDRFRSGELQALFTISAQLILQHYKAGTLDGTQTSTTLYITRASLAQFLFKRLISTNNY